MAAADIYRQTWLGRQHAEREKAHSGPANPVCNNTLPMRPKQQQTHAYSKDIHVDIHAPCESWRRTPGYQPGDDYKQ